MELPTNHLIQNLEQFQVLFARANSETVEIIGKLPNTKGQSEASILDVQINFICHHVDHVDAAEIHQGLTQ